MQGSMLVKPESFNYSALFVWKYVNNWVEGNNTKNLEALHQSGCDENRSSQPFIFHTSSEQNLVSTVSKVSKNFRLFD